MSLVGMNEAGLNANWLRKDLTHEETQNFAVRVLKHMVKQRWALMDRKTVRSIR